MAIGDRQTGTGESTTSTITFSHTVAGSEPVLWVCVSGFRSGGSVDPTGVTYNAVALTELADFLGGGGNDNAISLWRLINPAAGTANVVVTFAAATEAVAMSISYSGVDQTTPNDAIQENDSTATDPTHAITSETGDMVVDFVLGWGTAGDAWQASGGLTERLENSNTNGINSIAVGDAAGAASVTAAWTTVTNPSDPHGQMGFNVNQSGGAPPPTATRLSQRTTRGVG